MGLQNGDSWRTFLNILAEWESSQNNLYTWLGNNFAHGTGGLPQSILNKEKLRENVFELVHEEAFAIQNLLSDIKNIVGIEVFEYQPYIT